MKGEPCRNAQVGAHVLDRRRFLKGSATAIILAGFAPWLVGSTSSPGGSLPTKAAFQALVGQWFHVAGSTPVSVQLVAVVAGPASLEADQFTLVFSAPGGSLAEGTFAVTPPEGDAFDLFLQPDDGDGTGARVFASFNLLQPSPVMPSCT